VNIRSDAVSSRTLLLACVLLATACAARPAADIRGRWTPVNRYLAQTQEIPLRQTYLYQATPLDRTLKSLLARWARDTRMQLVYEHGSDFTLHAPAAALRSDDLHAAVARLNDIYAPQHIAIVLQGDRIEVRRGGPEAAP
jgi:hypothetical protein